MLMPTVPGLQALPVGKGKLQPELPKDRAPPDLRPQSCAKALPDVCSFFPAGKPRALSYTFQKHPSPLLG